MSEITVSRETAREIGRDLENLRSNLGYLLEEFEPIRPVDLARALYQLTEALQRIFPDPDAA